MSGRFPGALAKHTLTPGDMTVGRVGVLGPQAGRPQQQFAVKADEP